MIFSFFNKMPPVVQKEDLSDCINNDDNDGMENFPIIID